MPRPLDGTATGVRPIPVRAAARGVTALAAALVLLVASGLIVHVPRAGAAETAGASRAGGAGHASDGPVTALLEMDTPTSWEAWHRAEDGARRARRSPTEARRAAGAAGRAQRSAVAAAGQRVEQQLHSAVPEAQVLYRTSAVISALAVRVPVNRLPELRRLKGVRAVHPIGHKTRSNAYSVPLTGSPTVWAGTDAVPGNTGKGVTIGIIDSGIDYTHADFGGPGTAAAFQAVDGSLPAPPGLFPNAKVVGGWDLVGDDYNTDSDQHPYQPEPHPDPNPLDCTANGHGTHVAGTAAGYGVTRDGKAYAGPYTAGLDPTSFRIGPGAAPGATLYALRVFGCQGSSDVITQALDRAADPNQDGDFTDRLDVVNLSLGGTYGNPDDGDAVAADRLAATGTVVVASIGNSGDVYGVGSSPSVASRVISVAASVDGHTDADGIRVLPPAPPGGTPPAGPPWPAYQPVLPSGRGTAPGAVAGADAGQRDLTADPVAQGGVVPGHWSDRWTGWETQDVTADLALPDAADADGCAPFDPADAARLRGKIAVLSWTTADADRTCGSAPRADHAADAGAVGALFTADGDQVGEIAGDTRIPAVIVARGDGERLRSAATVGTPVRVQLAAVGNTLRGSVSQDDPQRADTLAAFSSRGIGIPGLVKPDIAAPGETILSAKAGSGSGGIRKDGTSMAAPHITGIVALVRAAHPDWTPDEVKAALMNTAAAELTAGDNHAGAVYGPERVGAGRVRADLAVRTPAIAYAAGDGVPDGAVGVSFGSVEVTGPLALTREVEVRNLTGGPLGYRTGYQPATEVPGASYDIAPAEVAVPAGGTARVRITLRVPAPAALGGQPDATLALQQAGHARSYRAEASGRLLLTPQSAGPPVLRVPVFAAPHRAFQFTAAVSGQLPPDALGRPGTLVRIGGSPESAGAGTPAPSLISAFVLGGAGQRWPDCAAGGGPGDRCAQSPHDRVGNLRLVGAASDAPAVAARGGDPLEDGTLYLAVSTWEAAATPVGGIAVRASLDTDGDGRTDAVVEADRLADSDVLVARTLNAGTGEELDVQPLDARGGDSGAALLDGDTVVLPVRLSALPGLRQSTSRIRYALWTGPTDRAKDNGVPDEEDAYDSIGLQFGRPALPLDVLRPALDIRTGSSAAAALAVPEQPGVVLEVRRDLWAYGGLRAGSVLLVHDRNANGSRAQELVLPAF